MRFNKLFLLFIIFFAFSTETVQAVGNEQLEKTLKELQQKVTPLLGKSSPQIKEEFQNFFTNGAEYMQFDFPLSAQELQAVGEVVASNVPLKTLCIVYPLNKSSEQALRNLLGKIETNITLEEINIKGGIRDTEAKILSDVLQKNRLLQHIYLENNQITSSGAAFLAKALEWNQSLVTLKVGDGNRIHGRWINQIEQFLQRNTTLAEKREENLRQARIRFSESVKKEMKVETSKEKDAFASAFLDIKRAFSVQDDTAWMEKLPSTEAEYLILSAKQREKLEHLDSILMAQLILSNSRFSDEMKSYQGKVEHLSERHPFYRNAFEIIVHEAVQKSRGEDVWMHLDHGLRQQILSDYAPRDDTDGNFQFVEKWQKRHQQKKEDFLVESNKISASLLEYLNNFASQIKQKGLNSQSTQALVLKATNVHHEQEEYEQRKEKIQDPVHTVREDFLNEKRTNFYKQLKHLLHKNFLIHEAIALGVFSRHEAFLEDIRCGFNGNQHCNIFYAFYFPKYGEVMSGEISGPKFFSSRIKLYSDSELRKKSLCLSSLHGHSLQDMEKLGETLAGGVLYRYQNQIPYLGEDTSSGFYKLAKITAGQIIDYALESTMPLPIKNLVISGSLHSPTWLQSADSNEKTTRLVRSGWYSSQQNLTYLMGKTVPCNTDKERADLCGRDAFELLRLSGIRTDDGTRYIPADETSRRFIKACYLSDDDYYRYGTHAEVQYLKDKLNVVFKKEELPSKLSGLQAPVNAQEEIEQFMNNSRAYMRQITIDLEDLLERRKE